MRRTLDKIGFVLIVALVGVLAMSATSVRGADNRPESLVKADALFKQQNWKDAASLYRELLTAKPDPDVAWHASLQLPLCHLRLQQYDEAVEAAQATVTRFKGTIREARAERVLGNLYLTLPHWGTEKGGKFYRNRWDQGIQKYTYALDRKKAVIRLERARDLYIAALAAPGKWKGMPRKEADNLWKERLDAQFDLAAAVTRFGPYDQNWNYWWYAWGEEEDETEDGTVDESHGLSRGRGDSWSWHNRGRPNGIPVDEDGSPIWDPIPDAYSPELPPGQKLKFLLREIEKLDRSASKDYAALSVYRRAMLARARYGPDRLQQYANWWDGQNRPYADEMAKKHLSDLSDNEALTLLGTKLGVVKLPSDEDILGLLRVVVEKYPKANIAHEAQYAVGVYYQSREQYTKALDEYVQYRELFPKGGRLEAVGAQEGVIKRPEVGIEQLGVQLAGDPATVAVTYRNAKNVHFKAYTIDLPRYIGDVLDRIRKDADPQGGYYYNLQNLSYALLQTQNNEKEPLYKKYLGAIVAEWDSDVKSDGSHRYAQARIRTPLKDRGCRLIEATVAGGNTSRNLMLLQDLAIVEKNLKGQQLDFVCDARGGQPVGSAKLSYFQFWQSYEKQGDEKNERQHWYVSEKSQETNDGGISIFQAEKKRLRNSDQYPQIITIARTADGRMAFSGVNYWSYYYQPSGQWAGRRAILFTDRPVYRPGQTVRAKLWCRDYQNGVYQKSGRDSLPIEVYDPKGQKPFTKQVSLDEYGGGEFEFKLDGEAALGMYSIGDPSGRVQFAGNQFRVEEYKKPEFEVTVEPSTDLAKLGDKVSGVIRAKYYFGAPVTNGTVKYRIYREDYSFSYVEPGYWDWLYGPGYGRYWYDYGWFPWWGSCCCRPFYCWYPWWGPPPQATRELVKEGEGKIAENGTLKFEFDSAPAKEAHPDKDHIYTIEAEVRDASRRVITGSGQVKVARQEFYAYVSVDRGYYQPGQPIEVTVRTLTPSGKPVSTKGKLMVSRVRYAGENNAKILEEPEWSKELETDEEGKLTYPLKFDKSGQFKIAFVATSYAESSGGMGEREKGGSPARPLAPSPTPLKLPITGATVVWVAGGDFDGSIYRFADLEILTDKRTYAPGEVAHLMLNCAREGATVLFSHRPDGGALTNYQLIALPKKSKTIDLPIEKGDVPNFFVEATVVFDGRVHQDAREILVPPTEGMINLTLKANKDEYRPGEKGRISVSATTPEGKPVKTQVAITAFDKSVLYIQPELTPDIRAHYWGQKRWHNLQMMSNLQLVFNRIDGLNDPKSYVYSSMPQDWRGSWGKQWVNWATDSSATLALADEVSGFGGGGGNGLQKATFALSMDSFGSQRSAGAAGAPGPPGAGGAGGEKRELATAEKDGGRGGGEPSYQTAQVRTEFADTALWLTSVETDDKGEATADITFPENLTGWKIRALGMTKETRVGDTSTSAVTTKNLLVRLQAPRFFMERDRVTLTANVHNYLKTKKRAKVSLSVSDKLLEIVGKPTTVIEVPANGEGKVDWEVSVRAEGNAVVKVEALTDEESDAMQMTFPVLVHGIDKTVSTCGAMRRGDNGIAEVELNIPADRNPSASRLEVRFSPSLAGAIIDALPYLLEYPYGCTEQTMSRFLPAVMVQHTLQKMGVNLEDLANRRNNLNAQELGLAKDRYAQWLKEHSWWGVKEVIYDTSKLNGIIKNSLERLYESQQSDGGWGWWRDDRSSSYMTAYVVWGLQLASEDDVKIDPNVLQRGYQALQNNVQKDVKDWKESSGVWNDQAFIAYVLSLKKLKNDDLNTILFDRRIHLTNYGKALLSLTLRDLGQTEKADLVLQNIRQTEKQDDENQTAWYDTNQSYWWYWWNNNIETNAWVLKAIIAKNPKDPVAPRLIKWLLNNRYHGYYWRSTRDTAMCATAFIDYMRAVGEDKPNYTLRVLYDGKPMKDIKITPDNFLSFDNQFTLAGDALESGRHTLRFQRVGDGALYYNTYLSYFTKEEGVKKAGLEIKVERQYYRMERADRTESVKGSRLQDVKEQRVRYKRIPLKDGEKLKSGDLIEVELRLISKNDYDYLIFEDMKAAGFEPVEVRSGSHYGELCSNMELRDEKVAFFVGFLTQGEHLIQYRMRAEIPGTFHALPTKGWAMYAPELRANSDEAVLRVVED